MMVVPTKKRPLMLPSNWKQQIRHLLRRDHIPYVQVGPSRIPGTGQGVLVAATGTITPGTVCCLYAGIYSPGFPPYEIVGDHLTYLAQDRTPNGQPAADNAYIINVKTHWGGYLDGQALEDENGVNLMENPSACGQFVNHSSNEDDCNVAVQSFVWNDVVPDDAAVRSDGNADNDHYALPNAVRRDGGPWYHNRNTAMLSCYNDDTTSRAWNCGVAVLATRILAAPDELLWNYSLTPPYPAWARDWYK